MPKVGKFFYRSKNYTHGLEVDVNFGSPSRSRVDQKDKYFWIKLPDEVQQFNDGVGHVSGNTNQEVIEAFTVKMNEYYSKNQKKRKVIGYKFDGEVGDRDNYDKGVFNKHEMTLEFVIGTITEIGGKEFFSTEKDSTLHALGQNRYSNYSDFTFINHSPEAEVWFVNTWTALKNMIKGCKKFFEQSETKLVQSMKSSKLLTYESKVK